jgi:salicylate hydroxylase
LKERLTASRWAEEAHDLIDGVESLSRWALFTVESGPAWSSGRVALLGDAAHAMLPFMAQGAAMAIEDAAVLAQCLASAKDEDTAAALRRYADLRAARVAKVQRAAQSNDRIYHLGGPIALARNLTMKLLGGERLLARQDWIYRWTTD